MDYICSHCKQIVGASLKEKNLHLRYCHASQYYKAVRTHNLGHLRLISFKSNCNNNDIVRPKIQSSQGSKKNYKFYRRLIYRQRGYFMDDEHICDCCEFSSTSIWRYSNPNGSYFYLCQKCKDKIRPNRQYVTIISTPMGGQNKR